MRVWADLARLDQCSICGGRLGKRRKYGICPDKRYFWYSYTCEHCQADNIYLTTTDLKQRISLAPGLKCSFAQPKNKEDGQLSLL